MRPTNALRRSATSRVNIAEPITAHTTGNGLPSILIVKIFGRPIFAAIHKPIYAPTNPTMIDTRQPPKSYPANDCPIEPHIAAIISRTRNPINVVIYYLFKCSDFLKIINNSSSAKFLQIADKVKPITIGQITIYNYNKKSETIV